MPGRYPAYFVPWSPDFPRYQAEQTVDTAIPCLWRNGTGPTYSFPLPAASPGHRPLLSSARYGTRPALWRIPDCTHSPQSAWDVPFRE